MKVKLFRIPSLRSPSRDAAGAAGRPVATLAQTAPANAQLDAVVVTASALPQEKSLSVQAQCRRSRRRHLGEDIGKMPDKNVADSAGPRPASPS